MSVLVLDRRYPPEHLAGLEVVRRSRRDVEAVLALPGTPFGAAEMDALPALRVIATATIGYDHIDVEAAAERGIWVCNVPDYCVEEVADHTVALVLALLRGVVTLDRHVRAGRWNSAAAGPLRTLAGLRVGIVGYGRIGSAVGRRLTALGCKVFAHDLVAVEDVPRRPLGRLLGTSDVVSVHVPLTRETEGLIGEDELARMRPGALLVNTSRGSVVDVRALVRDLREGHLGGAALDVLPEEPPRRVPKLPNLIVTPHAAWYSETAQLKAQAGAVAAVRAALAGRRPPSAVPETP
jgi:D-3-phosphoglycerate dehydrogenase / 2-oxoglutarate reductase